MKSRLKPKAIEVFAALTALMLTAPAAKAALMAGGSVAFGSRSDVWSKDNAGSESANAAFERGCGDQIDGFVPYPSKRGPSAGRVGVSRRSLDLSLF